MTPSQVPSELMLLGMVGAFVIGIIVVLLIMGVVL